MSATLARLRQPSATRRFSRAAQKASAAPQFSGQPRRMAATVAAATGDGTSVVLPAVVSPQQLAQALRDHPGSVRVLDASWYLPAMGRDAAAEFRAARIPGARFFDTDGVALAGTDLPHMLPPERAFAAAMDALGVANSAAAEQQQRPTHVVTYDGFGTFASPRLWWSLRAMGHDRVSVLSGGLPAWRAAGLPVDDAAWDEGSNGPIDGGAAAAARKAQEAAAARDNNAQYRAALRPEAAWSYEQMLEVAKANEKGSAAATPLVLDARPAGRFRGAEPEPRAHLRRGHIPGALNVPFATLLEGGKDGGLSGARLKSPADLRSVFAAAGVDVDVATKTDVVCSCGSGLTACIVALGLHEATAGKVDAAVYDASWCEWGAREDAPIVNESEAAA